VIRRTPATGRSSVRPVFRSSIVRLAAFLLAGLTAAACTSGTPPAAPVADAPLVAVAPREAVAWPFTFSWNGASPDAVVRVRVFDEAERAVLEFEARGSSVAAPTGLRSRLQPSATHLWKVARIDANGQEVGASELTSFSLK
jgi:hypothetical protein